VVLICPSISLEASSYSSIVNTLLGQHWNWEDILREVVLPLEMMDMQSTLGNEIQPVGERSGNAGIFRIDKQRLVVTCVLFKDDPHTFDQAIRTSLQKGNNVLVSQVA
jgi:hypothetical protein